MSLQQSYVCDFCKLSITPVADDSAPKTVVCEVRYPQPYKTTTTNRGQAPLHLDLCATCTPLVIAYLQKGKT